MSQSDIDLGQQAKNILANHAVDRAFTDYKAKIVENLTKCDPKDVVMLQTLQRHLVSLQVVRRNLEILVDNGVAAQDQLNFEVEQSALQRMFKRRA